MRIEKVENGFTVEVYDNNDYDWGGTKSFVFIDLDDALSFIKTTFEQPKQLPTS